MINLEEHFKEAEQGKKIWNDIDTEWKADHYIIFPHVNDTYNYYALLYLDEYLSKKQISNPVLLTADMGIVKSANLFSNKSFKIIHMDEKSIEVLLKYYALYEFTSDLTIISLTIPYNTGGENFLEIKGITKKDLLCFDIYRFGYVPEAAYPTYDGNDPDVKDFLKLRAE